MSILSAPSLQAYQAWTDPVRSPKPQPRPFTPAAADAAGRRGQPVVVNLSPQAQELLAGAEFTAGTAGAAGLTLGEAAQSYLDAGPSGAGRREAPFAHQQESPVYQPPGRVVDRMI